MAATATAAFFTVAGEIFGIGRLLTICMNGVWRAAVLNVIQLAPDHTFQRETESALDHMCKRLCQETVFISCVRPRRRRDAANSTVQRRKL